MINQFIKDGYNKGVNPDVAYWRDSTGNEIDLITTSGLDINAYEIKAGATFNNEYFKNLDKWGKLAALDKSHLNVIYNGDETLETSAGKLISFKNNF